MKTRFAYLLTILSFIALSGCKTEINPEWETYFSQASEGESRVEWLSNVAVDTYGSIISGGSTVATGSERTQNILVVKQSANGSVEWATEYDIAQGEYRSDDKITDMVLDSDGNVYLIGVRYIVENNQQRYGSFLLKIDSYGDVAWTYELSDQEDARDIEIKNDLIYVTGFATQIFNYNGQRQLKIAHEKAWDIEVDNAGNFYVTGATKAQKYSANGTPVWSVNLQQGLELRASLVLQQDDSVVVAHNHDDRTSRVTAISSDGQIQWSKRYTPSQQSYGFPGPALVLTDWRGNIVLSLSNDRGRRIVKLNDMGREQWQITSSGIVHELLVGDDGAIYAVGGGVNEKYDSDGKFVAATARTPSTQITTGSVAIDGVNMYLGYSAVQNGDIKFYLAKVIDK